MVQENRAGAVADCLNIILRSPDRAATDLAIGIMKKGSSFSALDVFRLENKHGEVIWKAMDVVNKLRVIQERPGPEKYQDRIWQQARDFWAIMRVAGNKSLPKEQIWQTVSLLSEGEDFKKNYQWLMDTAKLRGLMVLAAKGALLAAPVLQAVVRNLDSRLQLVFLAAAVGGVVTLEAKRMEAKKPLPSLEAAMVNLVGVNPWLASILVKAGWLTTMGLTAGLGDKLNQGIPDFVVANLLLIYSAEALMNLGAD